MSRNQYGILVFHGFMFSVYTMSLLFDFTSMDSWDYNYLGRLKFVTFWNLLFQVLHACLCVLVDVHGCLQPSRSSRLQHLRDVLHSSVVFPFGSFCVIAFWGFFFTNRDLVYPARLDTGRIYSYFLTADQLNRWKDYIYYGRIFNSYIVKHTFTVIFALIDKVLVHHHHSSRLVGTAMSIPVPLSYGIFLWYLGCQHGIWVYPFMEHLQLQGKFLFTLLSVCCNGLLYNAGRWISTSIWQRVKRD